jgi:aryl-alcohol dehydrogenase-like predicted oxidoreductase
MALTYNALGRTGVKVSQLCLGTMNFADGTDDQEAEAIIARFSEAGGNFIDTANVYAAGKSEEMLGRTLKALRSRDRFILATKVHGRMGAGPNDFGASRQHILRECDNSLTRLQTDYIDLYQIHRPDPATAIDETLSALTALVQAGKIRYAGCSTFPAWSIVDSLWASAQKHLVRFVSDQPPYNLLDRRIERDLLPMAKSFGLAVLPWGPLAGGMLSGKYRRGATAPNGSRYTNDRYRGAPIEEPVWLVLEALETLARTKNVTLSQFALAWILAQPGITSPIIGPRTVAQLDDNLAAIEVTITKDDQIAVDKIIAPGTFVKDYYAINQTPATLWQAP